MPFWPGVPAEKVIGKSFEVGAIDVHIIKNGLISQSWLIQDYSQAFSQIINGSPPWESENEPIGSGEKLTSVPQSIINLYDKALSDITGAGQDPSVIAQTVSEDWNLRTNFLNPIEGTGPGREGASKVTEFYDLVFSNFKFTRKETMLCGDKLVVISQWDATFRKSIQGLDEIPVLAGIPIERLVGKSFQTFAIDIQNIRDGLIKQTWHIEDYSTALQQMITGVPPADLAFKKPKISYNYFHTQTQKHKQNFSFRFAKL